MELSCNSLMFGFYFFMMVVFLCVLSYRLLFSVYKFFKQKVCRKITQNNNSQTNASEILPHLKLAGKFDDVFNLVHIFPGQAVSAENQYCNIQFTAEFYENSSTLIIKKYNNGDGTTYKNCGIIYLDKLDDNAIDKLISKIKILKEKDEQGKIDNSLKIIEEL